MLLSTTTQNDFIEIVSTAPTVVQPGEKIIVNIKILALQTFKFRGIKWELPGAITISPDDPTAIFPETFEADRSFVAKIVFLTGEAQEDFGEMHAFLHASSPEGEELTVDWSAWISVFKHEYASDPEGLSNEHRDRLVRVINVRPRNGQIALADIFSFCRDFLNIEIAENIIEMVSGEEGFALEGMPVSSEIYREFILGEKEYAFIEDLKVDPEELCPEEDDRFDADDVREIKFEEDDNA